MTIDRYSDVCKEDTSLRSYQQKAKRDIFESWDEVDNVDISKLTPYGPNGIAIRGELDYKGEAHCLRR